jgi:hypothetical protein
VVHLLRARCAILVAEKAEQRAAEVLRHVDRCNGRFGIELLLTHNHAASPQLSASVDVLPLAGIDERMPAARAGAEQTNLAVVIGLRAHPLHRGFGIADHLGVRNSSLGAHLGGKVVGIIIAAPTLALVQVGADREIAVMREPTSRLNVELAPTREQARRPEGDLDSMA